MKGGIFMFGERLALLRKEKKLSQYELADKLGFTRGQIANYEQGKRQPDFETLQKLADFFDTSIDYLLGRTDDRRRNLEKENKIIKDAEDLLKALENIPEKDREKVVKLAVDYVKFITKENFDN